MKKSAYTYYTRVDPDKLLMYNSMRGTSSFIKFHGEDALIAEKCINSPDEFSGTKIHQVLNEYGMIVPKELDEKQLCVHIAWKKIFNPTLNLIIMPTEDCNFRCSYCYETHKNGIMTMKTADSIIKYVRKNIVKHTELHVVWFGGEPLMSNDTIECLLYISDELIKICECARKKYSADIITNGYNLTYSVFEKLLKRKVFSYQVTIDGLASEHDKYRFLVNGGNTHDKIINNLLDIKNNCRKRYFNIVIRTNITSKMEHTLIEHYTELSGKFSDDSRFSFFFRPVGDWGGENVRRLSKEIYDTVSFKKIYEKVSNIQLNSHLCFKRYAYFYDDSTCSACYKNSYIIGFDGKIYKCSCHFEEPENNIGSLNADGEMVLD